MICHWCKNTVYLICMEKMSAKHWLEGNRQKWSFSARQLMAGSDCGVAVQKKDEGELQGLNPFLPHISSYSS